MASAPCLFITPLERKENTPARASRARTCAPFGQTDACLSRTCFLSTLRDHGRDAAAPQHQELFSILARDKVGKLRRGISKSFTSRLSTTAGAGRRQGACPARPRSSSLPTPSLQAAASPGHRRWKLPLPPFQEVSVLLSAVWGLVQNRQRAQLDTALLNTKGINNPAGDESSFSPRTPRAQIAFLLEKGLISIEHDRLKYKWVGPLYYSSVFSANRRGCAASFEVSSKAQGAHRHFRRLESKIRGNGALNAEHPRFPLPWVCNTASSVLLLLSKRSQIWFKPRHPMDLKLAEKRSRTNMMLYQPCPKPSRASFPGHAVSSISREI